MRLKYYIIIFNNKGEGDNYRTLFIIATADWWWPSLLCQTLLACYCERQASLRYPLNCKLPYSVITTATAIPQALVLGPVKRYWHVLVSCWAHNPEVSRSQLHSATNLRCRDEKKGNLLPQSQNIQGGVTFWRFTLPQVTESKEILNSS